MVLKPKVTVNGAQTSVTEKNVTSEVVYIIQIIAEVLLLMLKAIYFLFEELVRKCVGQAQVSVKDEIVLITGTGHGIGREMALKYASEGAIVVGVDINEISNEKTISDIKKINKRAYGYTCNVCDRAAVFELMEKIKRDVGEVTILVNNAGIMPTKPLLKQTQVEIESTMDLNVNAHFWLLQAFLPDMIKNNHGHIVAISSCAGLFGVVNLVPYCASKFAVRGLMEALFLELRHLSNKTSNIKLTVIYPYMVDTGLCKKPIIRFEKLLQMLSPKDVADIIVSSQRKGIQEISIPDYFLKLLYIIRMSPTKTLLSLVDFAGSGVEAED